MRNKIKTWGYIIILWVVYVVITEVFFEGKEYFYILGLIAQMNITKKDE